MGRLVIGDKEIKYEVKKGDNPKYVHIRFKSNLELDVVLPKGSNLDVESILKKKRTWIERKYDELANSKRIFDNGRVLYKGNYYVLSLDRSDEDSGKARVLNDRIVINVNGTSDARLILKEWMRSETAKFVKRRARAYAKRFGINLRNLYVKDTNRWGYCSKEGDLVFNWQLIALPEDLTKYVILHELAHLSVFNHSGKFRATLTRFCPDFVEREKALKNIYTSEPTTHMQILSTNR